MLLLSGLITFSLGFFRRIYSRLFDRDMERICYEQYDRQEPCPGEQIIVRGNLSGVKLVRTWIFGILCCWLVLYPTIRAIVRTVQWRSVELVVTDRCVRYKSGVIHTSMRTADLDKVQTATVSQNFWGKVFHYGSIYITTSAEKTPFTASYLKNAEQIKTAVINQMQKAKDDAMRRQAQYNAEAMANALKDPFNSF